MRVPAMSMISSMVSVRFIILSSNPLSFFALYSVPFVTTVALRSALRLPFSASVRRTVSL